MPPVIDTTKPAAQPLPRRIDPCSVRFQTPRVVEVRRAGAAPQFPAARR